MRILKANVILLVFVTEKARCAADFERPQGSGLWIIDDPPDADYQTCRIGENAYIYTPSEQKLTKEAFPFWRETPPGRILPSDLARRM